MTGILKDTTVINLADDCSRLQLRQGPIDLTIQAFGNQSEIALAYLQASKCFENILPRLVGEIDILRGQITQNSIVPEGIVANAMHSAALNFSSSHFVTPMIAVAGSVSDYVLGQMTEGRKLSKAFVNNGGDIALYLSPGTTFDVGICSNPISGTVESHINIRALDQIGGIATSGWRGRSHSMGIADAVTVLACDAATADVAATLVANATNLPYHPQIERQPAITLAPDSDLGEQLVTTHVGQLTDSEINQALLQGRLLAEKFIYQGLVSSVHATIGSQSFSIGNATNTAPANHPPRIRRRAFLETAHA